MKEDLKALISLLDDPDEEVTTLVTRNIMNKGEAIVPTLERAWEHSMSELTQNRIENIIQDIQSSSTKRELIKWCRDESSSLLKGAYLISKFQYPELKYDDLLDDIENISRDIWIEINNNLTALEKVKIMNHIIFNIYGFSANTDHIFLPQNTYINHLLETKRGNEISLSILYITLAERLNLPIYGVNLPNNFILAYIDEYNYGELFRDNVLFYIDPLSNGTVLSRKEIDHYLHRLNITPHESFYTPCSQLKIIQRLLSNLIIAYDKKGDQNKTDFIKSIFEIVSNYYEE